MFKFRTNEFFDVFLGNSNDEKFFHNVYIQMGVPPHSTLMFSTQQSHLNGFYINVFSQCVHLNYLFFLNKQQIQLTPLILFTCSSKLLS